jgi:hypothetical protein
MNKLLLIAVLAIVTALPIVSFNSAAPVMAKPQAATGWKKFTRPAYSVAYPPNWELKKDFKAANEQMTYPFVVLAPLAESSVTFRPNVNLVVETLGGINRKMTVEQYANAGIPQLEVAMPKYQLVDKKKLTRAGREYYQAIFTWESNGIELTVEQNYWVKNGKAYVVTLTTERERFEQDRKVGERILNSFVLK